MSKYEADHYVKEGKQFLKKGLNERALDYFILSLKAYSDIILNRPQFSQIREKFLEVWILILTLYPHEKDLILLSNKDRKKDEITVKNLHLNVIKSRVIDYLFENEWRIQYLNKFGGEKPLGVAWKSYYFQKEGALSKALIKSDDLKWAIENGHDQWVKYCIKKKDYEVSDQVLSSAFIAVKEGYYTILEVLFSNGGNVNYSHENGCSFLHYAVYFGNMDIVQLVLDFGAAVNACDNRGLTPLFWAVKNNYIEIAELLLAKGGDPSIMGKEGDQVITWMLFYRQDELALNLVSRKAFKNLNNNLSFSLLHYATIQGMSVVVKALIKQGEDVNQCDIFERTPLHWACQFGYLEIVKLCVEAGVDSQKKDRFNMDAFMLATFCKNSKIVNYLVSCQTLS